MTKPIFVDFVQKTLVVRSVSVSRIIMAVAFPAPTIKNTKLPKRSQTKSHSFSKSQNPSETLLLYSQTLTSGRYPDKSTLISALKACALIQAIQHGKSIHAHIVKTGFQSDRFLASVLIKLYSECNHLTSARQVFDEIHNKDLPLWTTLLVGYVQNGDAKSARQLFDEIPNRDVVAWNAMLSGYTQRGMAKEAIELFREMQNFEVRPNDITLASTLSACAQQGCLSTGEWVHSYIERNDDIRVSPMLINSLMHMYAKCGRLDVSYKLFVEKGCANLESWNTMLTSFAIHGCGMGALSLFAQKIKMGLMNDRITFMGLLMACSHGGMVYHAYRCFDYMERVDGIEPRLEHYGCLVDVLSRSGHFEEVCMIIENMPYEPDAYVWGSILNGCLTHGNYRLGEQAANRLLELEPGEESRYLGLLNLYGMAGQHEKAEELRKRMMKMGINKSSGGSAIEIDGVVHEFLAGDTSHWRSVDIYFMIEVIGQQMGIEVVYII